MNCTICQYYGKCKAEDYTERRIPVSKGSWYSEHGIKPGVHKVKDFIMTKKGPICSFFKTKINKEADK